MATWWPPDRGGPASVIARSRSFPKSYRFRGHVVAEPASHLACPGLDLGPVAGVALRHVAEREAQLLRIDHAAEDRDEVRMRTKVLERSAELLARAGYLVVLELERAEREDRKRALLEGDSMPAQEGASVCVPAGHGQRAAQDDPVAGIDIRDGRRVTDVDVVARVAKEGADGARHL